MTDPHSLSQSYYPHDFLNTVLPANHSFLVPLHLTAERAAEVLKKVFAPSAGLLYIPRPSKRQRVLNRAIDRLEDSALPGYEYAIAYLYDKYRRNLTVSTISQTGRTLQAFLLFYQPLVPSIAATKCSPTWPVNLLRFPALIVCLFVV